MNGRLVAVLPFVLLLAGGCKKKQVSLVEAGKPPEGAADLDAKDTVSVIVASYPVICDADAAVRAWGSCRESASGYGAVYGCAEKGSRDARMALSSLRASAGTHGACGEEVQNAAVDLLNATPKFFSDLIKWMREHHEHLAPALTKMSLGEACRAAKGLCAGEPHDYDDAYRAMRIHRVNTLECTAQIFRCGHSKAMDCWLGSVVPRLGVACSGTPNRTGASPDDLLYVRETGTPIAR